MYKLLSSQFEETQQTLKDIEENIKKITGRDPSTFTASGSLKWKGAEGGPARGGRPNGLAGKRPFKKRDGLNVVVIEEDEDEETPDEDAPNKKPSLQSTVVATHRSAKSRRDTLEEQKGDKRIFARNRRMFGMILGTLQKFQSEETQRKDQSLKKAEVDKKVELAAEEEKEKMKKEKEDLFHTRKEKQIQIRCLEKKLEIAESHELWERNQKLLHNFIQTDAKPTIMFFPSKQCDQSLKSWNISKEKITASIQSHQEKVERELAEIEECYNRDTADIEAEIARDKENYLADNFNPEQDEEMSANVEDGADFNNSNLLDSEMVNSVDAPSDFVNNADSMDVSDSVADDSKAVNSEAADNEKPVGDQDEFEPIYD